MIDVSFVQPRIARLVVMDMLVAARPGVSPMRVVEMQAA